MIRRPPRSPLFPSTPLSRSLATDAILVLATNVAAGIEVREPVIARHVAAHLPFLATEPLLLRGVKAGGDRQRLHEVIRTHSLAVAQAVAERGAPNDLLERLARDPAFRRSEERRVGKECRSRWSPDH